MHVRSAIPGLLDGPPDRPLGSRSPPEYVQTPSPSGQILSAVGEELQLVPRGIGFSSSPCEIRSRYCEIRSPPACPTALHEIPLLGACSRTPCQCGLSCLATEMSPGVGEAGTRTAPSGADGSNNSAVTEGQGNGGQRQHSDPGEGGERLRLRPSVFVVRPDDPLFSPKKEHYPHP